MSGSHLRPAMRSAGVAAAPLAAAAVGVFAEGGYSPLPRLAFGAVALAGALVAVAFSRACAREALREPVVLVLLALATVGALSALWTIGPVDRTLEWALVSAGYAAVAVAAAVAARRRLGLEALAAGIAVIAVVAAALGLVATVVFSTSFAGRIGGVWRPGGPFEYPPALALLQVSALPALLAGMLERSRPVACAAATGMALAGAVLALSASRLSLAMAVAVAGAAIVVTGRARRPSVAAAAALAAVAGIAMQLAAGAPAPARGGEYGGRLAALIAVAVLAPPLWLAARALLPRPAEAPRRRAGGRAAAAVVLALALVAGSVAFSGARGNGPASDFLHGRASTWQAAIDTFADRPLAGTGADAFLTGSARHQSGQTIAFAHDLPLELAAELGVIGFALALALYLGAAQLLWRSRSTRPILLFGPAVAAFLVASLLDWPWHLAGAGAVWSVAVGAVAGSSIRGTKWPIGSILCTADGGGCCQLTKTRRLMRNRFMAVAAVAAIGVAGCGGGDDNKALSYSAFGDKANEICKDTNAKIQAAGQATGNAQTDAPVLAKVIPLIKDANSKFKDLKPPAKLKATFDEFNSTTDQQIAQAEKAETAAKAGDQAAYSQILKDTQPLGAKSDAAASKLGAIECTK